MLHEAAIQKKYALSLAVTQLVPSMARESSLKMLEEHPEFEKTFSKLGSDFQLQQETLSSLEKFICLF